MQVGQIYTICIHGHLEECRLLAIRPFGTIDVMRLSDKQCFRVSGLWPAALGQ
jgi:hypothetical protein